MSLQVWLPLNGDLGNIGLSDVSVTNNGATVDNNGKIGKCYKFTNNNITVPINIVSTMSFACWVKCNAINGCHLFDARNNSGSGYQPAYIYSSGIQVGGSNSTFPTIAYSFTTNIWYHIAIIYSATENLVYINGELVGRASSYGSNMGQRILYICSRYSSTNYLNGYLNDVRIYDHCLSPKEIKEISKGLCLHYKLAGLGNPNMVTSLSAGGRTTIIDNYTMDANFGANVDTYCYINCSAMILGTPYTLSFDVSGMPTNGAWGWYLWNNTNYAFTVTKDGHYSYTFTPDASKLPSGYSLTQFLFDDGGRSNPSGTVRFSNFKLEKGSKATPWCPNSSDTLYTNMGFASSVEHDCSGYGNNGTKNGSIEWNGDTPRYSGSYSLPDSSSSITAVNLASLIHDGIFTMNIWFKKKTGEWSSKGYETIFGGPSGFEMELKQSSTNTPTIRPYTWGGWGGTYDIAYTLDEWHMLTMVRSSDLKVYLDGTLKQTCPAGSIPSGSYFFGAWYTATSQNMRGQLSDARIYATALSADDVMELYRTSALVDNGNNLMAYELVE